MSTAAVAAALIIGVTGAAGAAGPAVARGAAVAPGHVKVVMCTILTEHSGHHAHSVRHCTTELVTGTIRVTTAA